MCTKHVFVNSCCFVFKSAFKIVYCKLCLVIRNSYMLLVLNYVISKHNNRCSCTQHYIHSMPFIDDEI